MEKLADRFPAGRARRLQAARLKALWNGDCQSETEYSRFPAATSCPKPVQKPHPPLWVAARDPETYDWAIENDCSIMSWALSPLSEVELYKGHFDLLAKFTEAAAKAKPPFFPPYLRPRAMKKPEKVVFVSNPEVVIDHP